MTLRLQNDVATVDSDESMVLLDQRSGRYWQLNGTAAVTVRALLAGHTEEEVATQLSEQYPVSTHQAAADVTDLIARLHDAGLARS